MDWVILTYNYSWLLTLNAKRTISVRKNVQLFVYKWHINLHHSSTYSKNFMRVYSTFINQWASNPHSSINERPLHIHQSYIHCTTLTFHKNIIPVNTHFFCQHESSSLIIHILWLCTMSYSLSGLNVIQQLISVLFTLYF